ncbi:MAG TPA: TRAP transporter TatT component family protein [Anaeromyxobacteraceae bacterium]|nr:TRAP transporter TatT component family protein [Anaeromyxobacteraceae bacterium]
MKRILFAAAFALPFTLGCSAASGVVASEVVSTASGGVYAEDDDPELIRQAIPFGLKTMEGLLEDHPRHEGLLTTLASGFSQYSYAFVATPADEAELEGKSDVARPLRSRAKKLFLRAREYGLRGLDVRHKGLADKLRSLRGLKDALAPLEKDDVPLMYWTAVAWALAIANGKDDMDLVSQVPAPEALMQRALALDESFGEGSIHEFLLVWDAARGGADPALAKQHLDRALALSKGKKLTALVSYAESVSVLRQDRAEFTRLLEQVLAYDVEADPPHRLANVLAQRRARFLLAHADDLFS